MTLRTRRLNEFALDNIVWFMLLLVLVIFSIFIPNYFQVGIFANIIEASSVLGVLSIGLALVIISGHMDLSVESVAALSAMIVGILFCSAGIGLGLLFIGLGYRDRHLIRQRMYEENLRQQAVEF